MLRRSVCGVVTALIVANNNNSSHSVAVAQQRRAIFTQWGMTPQEEAMSTEGTATRLKDAYNRRSFTFCHIPEAPAAEAAALSAGDAYLLSAIEDDIKRLMQVDWTYEFDPFWEDRVQSHHTLFKKGAGQRDEKQAQLIEHRLNYLDSALKWAMETERRFTAIFEVRFKMQREVFDSVEREKILAGCVQICDEFAAMVPGEFKRKATQELELHLASMKNWVWDCPNAKRNFPRRLA